MKLKTGDWVLIGVVVLVVGFFAGLAIYASSQREHHACIAKSGCSE